MSNRELLRLWEKMTKAYNAFIHSASNGIAKENYRKYFAAQQEYKSFLEDLQRAQHDSNDAKNSNDWYTVAINEYGECGRLGGEEAVERCSKRYTNNNMSA